MTLGVPPFWNGTVEFEYNDEYKIKNVGFNKVCEWNHPRERNVNREELIEKINIIQNNDNEDKKIKIILK